MDTNDGIVTAEQLKAQAHKVVTGPSGFKYVVRRLSAFEFVGLQGFIPSLPTEEGGKLDTSKISPDRAALLQARVESIIKKGLVDPKVDDVNDIPGGDQIALFRAMADLIGHTVEDADVVRPT